MIDRIRREPALAIGLVTALIAAGTAFGLTISDQQSQAVVALVGAVLALVQAGATRSQVTPVATTSTAAEGAAVEGLEPEAQDGDGYQPRHAEGDGQ